MSQTRCRFFKSACEKAKTILTIPATYKLTGIFLLEASLFYFDAVFKKTEEGAPRWDTVPEDLLTKAIYTFALTGMLYSVMGWLKENHFPAKKFVPHLTAAFAKTFTDEALARPLTETNYPYVIGSAGIEGFQISTVLVLAQSIFDHNNYALLPVNCSHFKFMTAGLFIAATQFILDFIAKQMEQNHFIAWDELTPPRTLALNSFDTAVNGALWGMLIFLYETYLNHNISTRLGLGYSTLLIGISSAISCTFTDNIGYCIENIAINNMPFVTGLIMSLELANPAPERRKTPPEMPSLCTQISRLFFGQKTAHTLEHLNAENATETSEHTATTTLPYRSIV